MARYFIQTFGCQMNEADSEAMARLLEGAGYEAAGCAEEASLIVLNTCCVRAKPEQKVYSRLGELRLLKQQRPELLIAVAGCMAQKEGEGLLRRVPYVDMVVGPRQFHRLEEFIHSCREGGQRVCSLGLEDDPSLARRINGSTNLKAFIPIILGCDNHCTYCIVPSVRGRQKSRPAEEIRAEVEALAAGGCKEITLLGQNVLAYGEGKSEKVKGKNRKFADLLRDLSEVARIERIRFTTAHPRDVSDELIAAVAELPQVCEHFHLPIQAGDDRLLRAMGRGYTTGYYLEMVEKIRSKMPEAAITTDIMVGFPGETEEEFAASLAFYEKLEFDQAFVFVYSPRPGTPAEKMDGQVPQPTKVARLQRVAEVTSACALKRNAARVGRTEEVLVEGASEKNPALLQGRLRNNKMVVFAGSAQTIGQFVSVTLEKAHPWGFSSSKR